MKAVSFRLMACAIVVSFCALALTIRDAAAVECATSESEEAPEIPLSPAQLDAARGPSHRLGGFQINLVAGAGL